MGNSSNEQVVPRGALLGAAALVAISVLGAAFGRISGTSATPAPPAAVLESRELRFDDRSDGAVLVTDAISGDSIVVAPGTNGFMRGVLRGLAQERLRRHEGADVPFRLTRWSDGRLSLTDPVTQRNVYLEAFGPTNVAAFAALLDPTPHHD